MLEKAVVTYTQKCHCHPSYGIDARCVVSVLFERRTREPCLSRSCVIHRVS